MMRAGDYTPLGASPQALADRLGAGLKAEGISQEEIELMRKRNPGKLLGLEV